MDFSRYGNPSREWAAFEKSHPEAIKLIPNTEAYSPAELQAVGNAATAAASKTKLEQSGLWKVVESEDYAATGRDGNAIPIRCYRPKTARGKTLPAYIYFHGGAFMFGTLEADEGLCVAWAHALSMAVVSINYRHTPQVSGLAAWHDSIDAFEWIMSSASTLGLDPAKVTVGGISAGAMFAATVAAHDVRRARDAGSRPRLAGQVLATPALVQEFPYRLFADREKTSPVQCAGAAVLSRESYDGLLALVHTNTDVPLDHPTWNPGLTEAELLKNMPRTAILVSGGDVLRDEGLMYASRLRDAR